MKALMIAVLMLAAAQAKAKSVEACEMYTSVAVTVFDARLKGVPARDIYAEAEKIESQGMRNLAILATGRAFDADLDTTMEDFALSTFKRCRAGEV